MKKILETIRVSILVALTAVMCIGILGIGVMAIYQVIADKDVEKQWWLFFGLSFTISYIVLYIWNEIITLKEKRNENREIVQD